MSRSVSLRDVLAHNLRQGRLELALSQEKLAEKCGLHRTYIGSVERSERNISLSTLEVLSKALNISVPQLLTQKKDRIHEAK